MEERTMIKVFVRVLDPAYSDFLVQRIRHSVSPFHFCLFQMLLYILMIWY